MQTELIIATRESRLALWQAQHVRELLMARLGSTVQLKGMTTRGDQILDRSLAKVGGKGLFVKELEAALEEGRAHLAVHSLKDVPMELPEGFCLAAVLQREDPRDVWVSNQFSSLAKVPTGAMVGTSSLRRTLQLLELRPDLQVQPLRGNLDTRLRKLDEGQFAGIVLAAAGLKRLGMSERITGYFELNEMLPCAGQGALGLEVRSDAQTLRAQLATLSDPATWLAVNAERAVSRGLGGSCSMPLAAHAVWSDSRSSQRLHLSAVLGDAQRIKAPLLRATATAQVSQLDEALALGQQVVALLLAQDAAAYLMP
jgi:hydroxymethylbilane synthase